MRHGWLLALAGLATAGGAADRPLFADTAPLQLTLRMPPAGDKPVAATLTDGAETLPVSLTTRGITRRNSEICPFPPLRVAFTTPPAAGSPFAGQKKLKLVTHCRSDENFQQYLLLEYAAYRMYQLLTPISYKVRLARIGYQDARGKPMTERFGFFIEDTGDVAHRNGLHEFKTSTRVNPARLVAADAARYAVFQDLIANLDWAMVAGPAGTDCCHNSKLLGDKAGTGPLVPLPYDFDFSGLVDAPYATPPENVHVANVRERRYRGYCRHEAEARAAVSDVIARRAALLSVLDEVPTLSTNRKEKATRYLAGFFDQVASEDGLKKMVGTCVK